VLLALTFTALAAPKSAPAGPPCLAEAQKALADASPNTAGKAWLDVATCDAAAGKATAPEAWKRIIAGSGADAAAVKAIELGLGDAIRTWVETLQPDEKSAFINVLGEQCTNAVVPPFFLDTQKAVGDKFWSGRWYAGLDECRVPAAVEVLNAGLESQKGDPTRFKSILETLSRNLGKDAVPVLAAKLAAEKDKELATYIVGAFADAAGVGSVAGVNVEAEQAAITEIKKAAPTLPEPAVDQARNTLLALGSEADSDAMAAQRYRTLAQADGSLQYGIYVTKVATCKKDSKIEVHTALVTGAGRTWPDQVVARVQPAVGQLQWHLPKDCTGEVVIVASEKPLKDKAAFEAFTAAQDTDLQKKNAGLKAKVFADPPIPLQ